MNRRGNPTAFLCQNANAEGESEPNQKNICPMPSDFFIFRNDFFFELTKNEL